MHPNIEVMCMIKYQYATSVWLALPYNYDYCLASILFPDVSVIVADTAIPTSNFFFLKCF